MFKFLFSESTLLDLPLIVMIGFLALFTGVLFWTLSRRRSDHYAAMASLPLEDKIPTETQR